MGGKIKTAFTASVFASLLACQGAWATEGNRAVIVPSRVVSVHDGDTFFIDVDSVPELYGKRIGIRVRGVDTPEVRTKCEAEKAKGNAAKQFTENLLRQAHTLVLTNVERGKFFRYIADVRIDGRSLAEALIESGLGRVYNGGKRQPWC